MTVGVAVTDSAARYTRSWWSVSIHRSLDAYPDTGPRMRYLSVVVLATIVTYFQAYAGSGVSPLILTHYGMSFSYFLYAQVIFGALGAGFALIAARADRVGRANIVVVGLGCIAVLQLVITTMPNKVSFVAVAGLQGAVEGAVLVCTPALVRDFTPQLKRASAMGFWTLGPVVGSLAVSIVANHTLKTWPSWQGQYYITGITGGVMFLIALFSLRELSPGLRTQLMVTGADRALIQARARGLDPTTVVDPGEAIRRPWRQMVRWDLIGMSFGISVFLLVYFAAAGFFPIFLTTTFKSHGALMTTQQANGIDTWFWAFDAGALILIGALSDRTRIRKPFMVIGALGAIGGTIWLERVTANPNTGYYTLVVLTSLTAAMLAVAYAPWMASYTETVEAKNPALVATGLAVWGYVLRVVVAVAALLTPIVVSTVTPILNNSASIAKITASNPGIAVFEAHQALLTQLAADPHNTALLNQAIKAVGVKGLQEVQQAEPALRQLAPKVASLESAIKANPSRWQRWWWVCVAGEIAFIPTIFLARGRWSPRKAREDAEHHEQILQEEMARLSSTEAWSAS